MRIQRPIFLFPLLAALLLAALPSAAQDADVPTPPSSSTETVPEAAPTRAAIDLESVRSASIEADRWEARKAPVGNGILLTGTGNVRADITLESTSNQPVSRMQITADRLVVDSGNRILTAEGNVLAVTDEGTATGERLEYRWIERTGAVDQFTTERFGLVFRGSRLEYRRDRLVIHDGSFSTCGGEDPDYRILARTIEIIPDRRITARRVGLELFGGRLFSLPRLEYRLGRGRGQEQFRLPYPRPGRTRVSGFTLTQPIPLGPSVDGELELTTRRGIRGAVQYETGNRIPIYAVADWKQERPVRDRQPVLVSRLPQAGIRFGTQEQWDLNAAYIREHDTKTEAGRLHLTWDKTIIPRRTKAGIGLRVNGRAGAYTSGDTYATGGVDVSYGKDNGDTFVLGGIRENVVTGSTPFLWDEVQIETELYAGGRIAAGSYRLGTQVRYDLEQNEVYDIQVSVGRRFRCLEPEVRYSSRRESFYVGLRVFGPGTERSGEPRIERE